MSARRASGFTLLETIVTLVVVSLIVVVLMQALRQSLDLRTRLLRHERDTRVAGLQEQWFRDSVSAAVADIPDALGRMDGGPGSLELVSAAPLSGGGLDRIRWSLRRVDGGYALFYETRPGADRAEDEGAAALEVVRGPLQDASFAYLDRDGEWHAEWKSGDDAPRTGDAAVAADTGLPRMVRLHAMTATGELLWLVPVPGRPQPPEYLRLEDMGLGL